LSDELLKWRSEFPILDKTVYLISHSLGAMPRATYDRLHEYADRWASRGVRAWAEGWWDMPVTVGDDVTLNIGTVVQCHSQEDGAFKSDRITIGSGCTLGVGAFVHYGTTIGDGSVLEPDTFLMKGEEVPPHERWGGNPARKI